MALREWVALYDVSDDRARREVARAHEPFGTRVCYSTFEVHLDDAGARRLERQVAERLGTRDRYLLLRACGGCGRATFGRTLEPPLRRAWVV